MAVLGCLRFLQQLLEGGRLVAERTRNLVLRKLAQADRAVFARLVDDLEPRPLQPGMLLGAPRNHTDSVYFVDSGIVSLVATTRSGHSVEVALVGKEGVAGIADALGHQPPPYGLMVHIPGLAYRVPKEIIREHILSCTALHELLMDYSQLVMHQLAQSALCNRFHTAVQRLARWLLLTAERADTQRFELTHELVAQMVGAPRSAVSESASTLRDKGIIDYRRGVLTIRNPKRLHKIACECFDAVSQPLAGAGDGAVGDSPRSGRRKA
jgi:CRP-like cAMP-binding protein